jgi:hypothetical protein
MCLDPTSTAGMLRRPLRQQQSLRLWAFGQLVSTDETYAQSAAGTRELDGEYTKDGELDGSPIYKQVSIRSSSSDGASSYWPENPVYLAYIKPDSTNDEFWRWMFLPEKPTSAKEWGDKGYFCASITREANFPDASGVNGWFRASPGDTGTTPVVSCCQNKCCPAGQCRAMQLTNFGAVEKFSVVASGSGSAGEVCHGTKTIDGAYMLTKTAGGLNTGLDNADWARQYTLEDGANSLMLEYQNQGWAVYPRGAAIEDGKYAGKAANNIVKIASPGPTMLANSQCPATFDVTGSIEATCVASTSACATGAALAAALAPAPSSDATLADSTSSAAAIPVSTALTFLMAVVFGVAALC